MPAGRTIAARRNVPAPKPMNSYVYRQPGPPSVYTPANADLWHGRGVPCGFGYESQSGSVSMAAWRKAWGKYICEPSSDPVADNADAGLVAVLYPVDEIDNLAVQYADTGKDPEQVYAAMEAWCKITKKSIPNKPTCVNLGLEQIRWAKTDPKNPGRLIPKVDYARILAAFDIVSVDYYPVTRSLPITDYAALIDKLKTLPGGDKVKIGFVECSNQHLNPTYYPHCRAPTPAEFTAQLEMLKAKGMEAGLFAQQLGEDGTDFLYDAMPAELVAAFATWAGKPVPPAPSPLPPAAKTLVRSINIDIYSDGSSDVTSK